MDVRRYDNVGGISITTLDVVLGEEPVKEVGYFSICTCSACPDACENLVFVSVKGRKGGLVAEVAEEEEEEEEEDEVDEEKEG